MTPGGYTEADLWGDTGITRVGLTLKKFVAAFYQSDSQAEKLIRSIKKWLPRESPFHPDKFSIYQFKKKRMLIATLSSATQAFSSYQSDFISKQSGLIFDGAPFFPGFESSVDWAEQVHKTIGNKGPYHILRNIFGDYCLVRYCEDEVFAMSDFLGLCPIFWMEKDGVVIVSNRQRLIHRVLLDGKISISPLAASWLTGQGNIFGSNSIYDGVKIIQPGSFLRIVDGKAAIGGMPRFYRPEHSVEDYSPEQVHDMVGKFFAQADAMSNLPFDIMNADLTGGMDSRAVMALMAGSKMRSKLGTFRTFGPGETGEKQIARIVADVGGVAHEVMTPRAPSQECRENLWRRLRLNVAITDGTILANAALSGLARTSQLTASGTGGEVFRPHIKSRRVLELKSRDDAQKTYGNYQQANDPLSIQNSSISAAQRQLMRDATDRYHSMGVDYDDIHYAFYGEHRCPWWSGYALSNAFGRRRVFPLVNYEAVKIAFSASPLQRKIDRLHFEIMRHLSMDLVKTPFLDNVWDRRLQKYYAGDFIQQPYPSSAGKPDTPWFIGMANREWVALFDLILSKENSVIRDIADIKKLELRRSDKESWVRRPAAMTALLALASFRLLEDDDYSLIEKQGETADSRIYTEVVYK